MESFEYRDLLVAIWSDPTPGFFRARAREEFGRSTSSVRIHLPLDDRWFVQYVDRIDELNFRELHYVGARLFDSTFQGDILRLYIHLIEQIRATGAKLRIRLQLDPPIVARLPWECLYDTRHTSFLGTCDDVSLVRYMAPRGDEPAPVSARAPLKVLLAADRTDGETDVEKEGLSVREVVHELEGEGLVSCDVLGSLFGEVPLRMEELSERLSTNFDVLHLFNQADGDGSQTTFRFNNGGVPADVMVAALGETPPRLVIWSGGRGSGRLAPAFAEKLMSVVPALLSQGHVLSEDFLGRHTDALYRALSAMKPLDAALAMARVEVLSQFPHEAEWLSPALFTSRRDARILQHQSRPGLPDVHQISEGRYRRHLRETLNRLWPKPERYSKQMLRWLPRLEPLASYIHAADFLGQPQEAKDLSSRLNRLLLLGEAGSGKSMTLYRLFYEAAQAILFYQARSPLPVFLSLPDVPESTELFDHLAAELDRDLFISDLTEGRFLFLVDSLDGLSSAGAAARTDALNAFMQRFPMNRFVVTARQAPPKKVEIPDWVEMLPFAEWEAIDFLIDDEAMRPESARVLYRQLAESLGPRVGNPQVLAMARRLWREGARVPSNLTGLFLAFFQVAGTSIVPETREGLLPQLAFFMSKGDRLSLRKEHLERERRPRALSDFAVEALFRKVVAKGTDELLAEVEKTRLLRGPGAFYFPSMAFQEFLTAFALQSAELGTLVQLTPPADWREVHGADAYPMNLSRGPFHGALPFLCGLRDDGPAIVEQLVERDLVLASACFREAPPSTSLDLMLRAAVERGLASSDSLHQRLATMSLEARADSWAIEWLERLAAPGDSPARPLALAALGNLRSHRSVPVLESAAREDDPVVARAALDALARLKAS